MNDKNTCLNIIERKYSGLIEKKSYVDNEVNISSNNLLQFMHLLKNDKDLKFNILCDHTAVDWINVGVFDLIYNLYSTEYNYQLLVITGIQRSKPIIDTVSDIWRIAEFQEREVYDFFGVIYKGHPDLRRLFLEDDWWIGFPLRKDYKDNFILEI
jgi:NADH:ubiquinone oxidoreductase subunit C